MDKHKLYILVGIPGAGKSYWIQKYLHKFPGYTKVVSRDAIRFSLISEDDNYFSKEKIVFNKFVEEIKDGLVHADNTIADATHLNCVSRTKLLRALGNKLKNIEVEAIVIKTTYDTAIERNANRTGRAFVPPSAIKRMFNSLTIPSEEEGFNKIWIYDSETGRYS